MRQKSIDTVSQFHQRFTHAFFVQNFGVKKSQTQNTAFVIFGTKISYKKLEREKH